MLSPATFSTPFANPDGRTTAVVASGADAYANARRALARFDLGVARNRRVLLKPNAGRIVRAGLGITTEPQVVAAAIDAFVEAGADVSVGDSPIVGVRELQALESSGIADVVRARRCRLLYMDKRRYVELPLPEGRAIRSLRVCPDVFEHDIVVSIPVMKTHMHTRVSLAVKNMKGCLWRRSKVDLHMLPAVPGYSDKSLDVAIADMSAVLRPHLSLIDGTVGMQGLGPSAGTQKPLGVVVASADAFAADAVACQLMGIAAEEVPHLRLGAAWGYGIIDLERIEVTPENWQQCASPFERAPTSLAIEFAGVDVRDDKSCSACQSTLLLYLRRFGEKLVADFGNGSPVVVAIGKGHVQVPEGTICIGNCLLEHRARGVFVPGCPPVGSAIERTIDAARAGTASPAYAEEIETDEEDAEVG
jgi:uncharacterized protein (DUF362 family)